MGQRQSAAAKKEQPKAVMRCRFDDSDRIYEIDLMQLRAREEILIEAEFDMPLGQIWAEGWMTSSARGRVFLAWLARRREEPQFTHDQALEFEPEAVPREEAEEGVRPTGTPKRSGRRK